MTKQEAISRLGVIPLELLRHARAVFDKYGDVRVNALLDQTHESVARQSLIGEFGFTALEANVALDALRLTRASKTGADTPEGATATKVFVTGANSDVLNTSDRISVNGIDAVVIIRAREVQLSGRNQWATVVGYAPESAPSTIKDATLSVDSVIRL